MAEQWEQPGPDHHGWPPPPPREPVEAPSPGRAIAAIVIGALVLVLALAGVLAATPEPVSADTPRELGRLMGGLMARLLVMMAVGGVVWAVPSARCCGATDRGLRWGTLAGFLALAGLFGLVAVGAAMGGGRAANRRADERASLNEMRRMLDADDPSTVTLSENGGPMQRMLATAINAVQADTRAFEAEAERSHIEPLLLGNLRPGSPDLQNCARFDVLSTSARRYGARWPEHAEATRRIGGDFVSRGELSQDELEGFMRGLEVSRPNFSRRWELTAQVVDGARELCDLLASRRWTRQHDRPAFYTDAETARYNAVVTRVQAAGREQVRIVEQGRANMARVLAEQGPESR